MENFLPVSLKNEFPIFKNNIIHKAGEKRPLIYLDTGATAQKPGSVIDAMKKHMECDYGSVHRGAYQLSIRSSEAFEKTRADVARFISPLLKPEQVIFTSGTTASLNLVARSLSENVLTENDRIVLPMAEHHANFIPWQQAALRANCEVAYIPFHPLQDGNYNLDLIKAKKIIASNTKVISLASVGNVLGQINPLPEIISMAKKVGAFVIIDCAQSIATSNDDYFAMGADAVAFSGHKIFGPSGIGVLALSENLLNKMEPTVFGGGMISTVTLEGCSWTTSPFKFEAGSPPVTEVVGLGEAIKWIDRVGRKNLHDHNIALSHFLLEQLSKIEDVTLYYPHQNPSGSVISFRHNFCHAHDAATYLDTFNICVRAGHHCAYPLLHYLNVDALIRMSFGPYVTKEDLEITTEVIKSITKYFS